MMYFVYIVECADKSLYTGSTTDIERRLSEHNGLKSGGARYTRIRRPVRLLYGESLPTLGKARSREAEIKGLSRIEKLALIRSTAQLSFRAIAKNPDSG